MQCSPPVPRETAEDEEHDELLCVGGPYAGRRLQVRKGEKLVRMLAPVSIDVLDQTIQTALSGGEPVQELMIEAVHYERVPFCERPNGKLDPDFFEVLALVDRRGTVLRELIAGYRPSQVSATEAARHAIGDLGPARRHVARIMAGELPPAPMVLHEIAQAIARCVARLEGGLPR